MLRSLVATLRDRPGDKARVLGRLYSWDCGTAEGARSSGEIGDRSGRVAVEGDGATLRAGDLRAGDIVELTGYWDDLGARFVAQAAKSLQRPSSSTRSVDWLRLSAPSHHARLRQRSRAMRAIRDYFDSDDFLEVETGQMVDEPGQEPTLDLFEPAPGRYLITSPELRMKRLLAAGHERIYELSHCFRRGLGERSTWHHPEFTMLEWYRAYEDEEAIATDLEALLPAVAIAVGGRAVSRRGGKEQSLAAPFERLTVAEAFSRYAGVDLEPFLDGDHAGFRSAARRGGILAVSDDEDTTSLYFRIMLDHVESRLGEERPTLLHRFPASMAALAQIHQDDPRCARRFECYVAGVELANAFSELVDPIEQRRRFDAERAEKSRDGRDPGPFPTQFLRALEDGIPPCAGVALGVDRLVMLTVGVDQIDDVLPFPDPPGPGAPSPPDRSE